MPHYIVLPNGGTAYPTIPAYTSVVHHYSITPLQTTTSPLARITPAPPAYLPALAQQHTAQPHTYSLIRLEGERVAVSVYRERGRVYIPLTVLTNFSISHLIKHHYTSRGSVPKPESQSKHKTSFPKISALKIHISRFK